MVRLICEVAIYLLGSKFWLANKSSTTSEVLVLVCVTVNLSIRPMCVNVDQVHATSCFGLCCSKTYQPLVSIEYVESTEEVDKLNIVEMFC